MAAYFNDDAVVLMAEPRCMDRSRLDCVESSNPRLGVQLGTTTIGRRPALVLDQVPSVARTVFEHCHGAVALHSRSFEKSNARLNHPFVIGSKVVGIQEEGHATTSLNADLRSLQVVGWLRQQDRHRFLTGGPDHHSPFPIAQVRVFDQIKTQAAREEGDPLVVIVDQE